MLKPLSSIPTITMEEKIVNTTKKAPGTNE
jgi:hypothetical protein